MRYFPINLDILGKKVLVVGGGQVACRKVKNLLACGARVTVVSPSFCRELARMKKVRLVKRRYRKSDMRAACIVVSAADSRAVNSRVHQHAAGAGILVNVVDQPDLCAFTVPAVVSRGELLITISTGGGSPALARRIREMIETEVGPAFARHLKLLQEMRPRILASPLESRSRARLMRKMAGDRIHREIKQRGIRAGRRLARRMLVDAMENAGKKRSARTPL